MVIDERSEEEPDEPEFAVQSGEDLVPESPAVEVEQPAIDRANDVPEKIRQRVATSFWSIVFLLKPALFGLSLGPLLLYFTEYTRAGVGAICIGVFSSLAAYRRYRHFMADPPASQSADDQSTPDPDEHSE